jgi:inorganic pyrophosphatase
MLIVRGSPVDLEAIPALAGDDTFHVVIESPRGSSLKLKYSSRWNAMGVSRPLPAGLVFPFDWGFIPSTRAEDGDPLDAFLMWDVASFPGVVVVCRALGVLNVEQNAENFNRSRRVRNDRIVALPVEARREPVSQTINDIPERIREEWAQFTVAAGALDGKDAAVLGFGSAADAFRLVTACALGRETK